MLPCCRICRHLPTPGWRSLPPVDLLLHPCCCCCLARCRTVLPARLPPLPLLPRAPTAFPTACSRPQAAAHAVASPPPSCAAAERTHDKLDRVQLMQLDKVNPNIAAMQIADPMQQQLVPSMSTSHIPGRFLPACHPPSHPPVGKHAVLRAQLLQLGEERGVGVPQHPRNLLQLVPTGLVWEEAGARPERWVRQGAWVDGEARRQAGENTVGSTCKPLHSCHAALSTQLCCMTKPAYTCAGCPT